MRKAAITFGFVCLASIANAQIVPPAPGVDLPQEVLESVKAHGKDGFQFKHAWIKKAEAAREARERYIDERGFYQRDMIPQAERPKFSVSGTYFAPVFCVKYSDTGADPYPISNLTQRLFTGPHVPRTMTQFYSEISYGDLNLTGTVYGWTALPNTNAFYTGAGTCNGICGSSQVKTLITQTIAANDAAVNFGQYDNDGPDGLPNSGDDDGFVDFAAFVHPEQGAECGVNGNIWSHRFSLQGWGVLPYTTNDARTGGGLIRVNDYVIMPAFNCGGATIIDIGVFCHEFGHAFGLPDLYDTNGGSEGVGHWCLMGSGNWNTPTNPAHMSAWSKNQLGWSDVTVVDYPAANYNIANVENNRDIYRLDVMHERFRRSNECPIAGTWSLKCGLTTAEATQRNWTGGRGYGNGWDESVFRDFNYNGAGSVTLNYQYSYNLEPTYDFAHGEITVNGTTSEFALYDGIAAGNAVIDLTPYLAGGPKPYRITFRMTSDVAYSDEDGSYPTPCSPLILDNITVNGGGEAYSANFETREDGWVCDMEVPNEHFFVENRKPIGSDVNVWGGGGLAIWHVDEATTHGSGNSGGTTNTMPRGLALEQADGLFQLESGLNRGNAGDPWPGSTNKTLFNSASVPNSNGYNTIPTNVSVQLLTGNADPIVATMTGGAAAPGLSAVAPTSGVSNTLVQLVITGSNLLYGSTVDLVLNATTIPATGVYWDGKDRIVANFNLAGAGNGFYDVVVTNTYNASSVLTDAFEVTGAPTPVNNTPKEFVLRPNYPNPFNPTTTIRYEIAARSHVELRVYDVNGSVVRSLVDEEMPAGSHVVQWNGRNDAGDPASSGVYFYRLTAPGFSDVRKMTLLK